MKKKVLFFGRKNCLYTKKALSVLDNLNFNYTFIESSQRGEKVSKKALDWQGDYIFCFRSLFIVPEEIIKNAKIAAINFHPGPPEYPGSGCINFALFEESRNFGVTAHLMNKKIDSGKILSLKRFPILKSDDISTLLKKTHKELFLLFKKIINNLDIDGQNFIKESLYKNRNESWSGKSRKIEELDKVQKINMNITKSELEKIIMATHLKEFPLKIILHGYEFNLDKK